MMNVPAFVRDLIFKVLATVTAPLKGYRTLFGIVGCVAMIVFSIMAGDLATAAAMFAVLMGLIGLRPEDPPSPDNPTVPAKLLGLYAILGAGCLFMGAALAGCTYHRIEHVGPKAADCCKCVNCCCKDSDCCKPKDDCKPAKCPVKHGWQPGPLPPKTFGWGGVQPIGWKHGFTYADFCGDHVKTSDGKRVEAKDVAYFNNCIQDLPPNKLGKEE